MKKLIMIFLALIPLFSGCQKEGDTDSNLQIREIAWNWLSVEARSTVIIDWKEAPVTASTFNQKRAYAVRFNTSKDELLGPITVYVDISSKVVLGQALRD